MAWKRVDVLEQRAKFVVRAWRGEPMSALCQEYGISRPTGYLWKQRFAQSGVAGLHDQSRRPMQDPDAGSGRRAHRSTASSAARLGRAQAGRAFA